MICSGGEKRTVIWNHDMFIGGAMIDVPPAAEPDGGE
jgi:hypothetical protein